MFVIERKRRDFSIVLKAVQHILAEDSLTRWSTKLITIDNISDSELRHTILLKWIQGLSDRFQVLGSLGVSGKRDFEVMPDSEFDAAKDRRTASLLELYPVEKVLDNIKQEGAYTRGLVLVLRDQEALLEVELKGKRRRMDVTIAQKREFSEDLPVERAEQLQGMPTLQLDDDSRIELASEIWRCFCESFCTEVSL